MGKGKLLLIIIVFFPLFLMGQGDRYMVFFSDKNGTLFDTANPQQFLSERAIQRRMTQNILIDETDLPISPDYVMQIRNLGIATFYPSKWFNALLVQATESEVQHVEQLSFVDSVLLVAQGERPNGRSRDGLVNFFGNRTRATKETAEQNELLSIDVMHNQQLRGEGIAVAVFDGGFEGVDNSSFFQHVFDDERMLATKDFVTGSDNVYQFDDHGTRAFSAIAGLDGDSFIGVAHQSSFVLCVTEDVGSETRIEEYNWLFAAEFADSVGVDIISTSLGYNIFDDPGMNYELSDLDGMTATISRASNLAGKKGMLLVAAAGNEGNNSWGKITPPADSPYVLSVGSISSPGELSGFSSFGPTEDDRIKPDVVALGSGVSVVGGNGSLTTSSGTSFSAPLIAGLVAGVWQADRTMTNLEVIEAIRMSGDNSTTPDNFLGYGVPNYIDAVPNPILSVEDIMEGRIKVYPNPFRENKIFISLDSYFTSSELTFEFFNLSGVLITQKTFNNRFHQESIQFDIEQDILPGTYILRVSDKLRSTEVKLLKF